MQLPYLDGVEPGPTAWTVHVPAGFQPSPTGEKLDRPARSAAPASAAGLQLRRAACQYQLSTILASKIGAGDSADLASLASTQQRFYRACRKAEQHLAMPDVRGDTGPGGQALDEWVATLREDNRRLARKYGFESLRAEAEHQAQGQSRASSLEADPQNRAPGEGAEMATIAIPPAVWSDDFLPQRGVPLYWQGAAGASSPRLVLHSMRAHDAMRALGFSIAWLAILFAVGLATQFAKLRNWLRMFWPEQVALLGCFVWQTFDPGILPFFLIITGICGRVILLAQSLWHWSRRTNPVPPPAA
jgi:hypothetical protein